MDFYTMVLRQSGLYWVALCLENGLVGQGTFKEDAVTKLKEAIESLEDAVKSETDVFSTPLTIKDLHDFLTVEGAQPTEEYYELRAVNA